MPLSIIIPIYKENNNIIPLNKKLNSLKNKIKIEIIFVDDNSNDGTINSLKFIKKKYNTQYLIRKSKKKRPNEFLLYGHQKI